PGNMPLPICPCAKTPPVCGIAIDAGGGGGGGGACGCSGGHGRGKSGPGNPDPPQMNGSSAHGSSGEGSNQSNGLAPLGSIRVRGLLKAYVYAFHDCGLNRLAP